MKHNLENNECFCKPEIKKLCTICEGEGTFVSDTCNYCEGTGLIDTEYDDPAPKIIIHRDM